MIRQITRDPQWNAGDFFTFNTFIFAGAMVKSNLY